MTRIPLFGEDPTGGYAGPVMLASGHRPFFLMAALYAPITLILWLLALSGQLELTSTWHGHELVFGFALAGISGFLMAAVPKWTQRNNATGWPVALLASLWLAGRVAVGTDIAPWVDAIYPFAIAARISADILAARSRRNYIVIGILFTLAGFNVAYHLGATEIALRGGIYTIVILLVLIGGRIIPAFTQNALRRQVSPDITCSTPGWAARVSVPFAITVMAAETIVPSTATSGIIAIVAGLVLLAGMSGWRSVKTGIDPLVWVLHAGYVWIPAGYIIGGLASMGLYPDPFAALHALTAGAIGMMIMAVGSRAALGHSGRPLKAARPTVVAYLLVLIAALLRVFTPFDGATHMAGGLWILGYGLFGVTYWPILTKKRIDGLPG